MIVWGGGCVESESVKGGKLPSSGSTGNCCPLAYKSNMAVSVDRTFY